MVSADEYACRQYEGLLQVRAGRQPDTTERTLYFRSRVGFNSRVIRLLQASLRHDTRLHCGFALAEIAILICMIVRVEANDVYAHAVVATDHVAASEAGLMVLKLGGNVVDAAVASSFALSVVRPASCGIGGGGFMVIWNVETQQATALDYREIAPAAATRDMFIEPAGTGAEPDSVRGGRAIGIPGTVAGLCFAADRHGTLPLKTLLAPAIRLAKDGVEIDAHDRQVQQMILKTVDEYGKYKENFAPLVRLYLNRGVPWKPGDRFHSPQLELLQLIASHGRNAFYRGEVANAVIRQVEQHNGILSAEDLSSFAPKIRKPVHGRFRNSTIYSMPPPSSGGIALIQTLQTLGRWEDQSSSSLNALGHNSAGYIHIVAEAMKHAFADRSRFLGDTDFVTVPVKQLLSQDYANHIAAKIDRSQVRNMNVYGRFFNKDDSGTSHISIIDAQGNAVACTETINLRYGSFVVVPEYGIVLNNEMDDFSARPGEPNAFGLLQSEANAIQPGKKPLSSMTPTIAVRDGRAVFASGASGGPRIISATLQVTLNHLVFGMKPQPAVAAPRFHHQWYPDALMLESGFQKPVWASLQQKGHCLQRISTAGVNQSVSGLSGKLHGASDPRKYGLPAGF